MNLGICHLQIFGNFVQNKMFRMCHTNVISLELILTQEMPSKVLRINSRSDHVLTTNQRIGYMNDFNVISSCLHVMKLLLVMFDHTIYGKQEFNLLGNMYSYWSVGPIHDLKDVTIDMYYIICFARKPYIISTERLFAVKCMVRCVMLFRYRIWLAQHNIITTQYWF